MAEVVVEDVRSREEQKRDPLYVGRVKVHPKDVRGTWRRIKWAALVVLLGIYYVVPWIRWDRGPGIPDQAVLVDMPARRAYFFWIEIWPQEVYYITGLLILGAVGLFLATALFGRVWCGYACPQTVWTDLFMWVERRIEGNRGARIRLDNAPLSQGKLLKRSAKHAVWLLIAFATGGAWIMYFNDAPTVIAEIFTGRASLTVYFFVGLFTATTYLLAGHAREQVCTYMCPWPRFQAALTDEDSLVVTYQRWRGEPRAPFRRGEPREGKGDCIDCRACVAVCPTGIDIRDGYQLECIGCGLCIDACNDVMSRVGLPRELITYDTERNQHRKAQGRGPVWRLVRPRTLIYAGLLAGVGLLMLGVLLARSPVELNVLHDGTPLYVTLSDGSIRNAYTVRILNKTHAPGTFALAIEGLPEATLRTVGSEAEAAALELPARADGVTTHRVFVRLPREQVPESMPITFRLDDGAGPVIEERSVFRGPSR
jgi:cytochrome c oxidase accessory protein FixG